MNRHTRVLLACAAVGLGAVLTATTFDLDDRDQELQEEGDWRLVLGHTSTERQER